MKVITLAGSLIVTLALISYSVAIITEQRKRQVTSKVMNFLRAGIALDITATACMIIGSSNSPFTLHGTLGYSSLTAMLIDTILVSRFYRTAPEGTQVPKALHLYSRFAYAWWVIAYITGGMLVAMR